MAGSGMSDEDLLAQWDAIRSGVARVQRRIDRMVEDSGVPAQWFAVLHLLLCADDHRMPMSQLARDLSITSGGFTKLADRMARDGLIDRRGSTDDRRVVHTRLTADGLRMAKQTERRYLAALRECLLDVVSDPELTAVAGSLRTLGEATHVDRADLVDVPGAQTQLRDPALPDRRRVRA
jgi:DNA-binding MarR family transcriptional regulator